MYNGVKDDSGSSAAWERPWSTEEMRKQSPRWNLAGDAGLLEFLQDFSQRMISRTHEVEQMVNTLCHETKVTNAKVSNIVNDFHMLSNTQFVESRVYDEDIPEPVKEDKKLEKTKQERENEVVGKISNALNLGLSVMEEAFERVEIQQDSDSEDEDSPVHRQILLQPKDPYLQRPLPHLIGTKAFLDDDYVGIGDFSEDEEEDRIEKEESEASSDDDSIPEERPNLAHKLRDEYESESLSGGSDMFQENDTHDGVFDESSSDTSDDDEDLLKTNGKDETDKGNQPPPLLAEQLDAKIKQYVRKKTSKNNNSRKSSDTQSIRSRQSIRSTSKNIPKAPSEEDLFGAAIPSEEDELFGRKGGLFSGTGKMFDESQENSGLFDEVSKPEKEVVPENEEKLLTPRSRGYTKSGKKIPAGAISIVGGENMFEEKGHKVIKPSQPTENKNIVAEPATEKVLVTKNNPPPSKTKPTGGLFDSDDNDDDDLFSNTQKPSISSPATKGKKSEPSIKSGSLFFSDDENENDLFGAPKNDTIKNVPIKAAKKAPVGGVSVFGSLAGEIGTAIKSKRPKDDSDSEKSEDLSETRETTSIKSQSSFQASKKIVSKDSRSNSVSSNSLFADDPEIDDLFTKKEETTKPATKTATSLFKDNLEYNDDFDSLFSATKPVAKGESSQPSVPVKSTSQPAKSIFEDIDEDDLFSIASKPAPSKTKPSSSLSVSEDDGPKNQVPVVTKDEAKKLESKKELPKVKEITPAPKISLFDDNQDDDLFSVSSKLSQSPASMDSKSPEIPKSPETSKLSEPTKVRSTSLFDDDDVLFGGPNEESPEIDLFKSAASDKNNKGAPETAEKKPISNTVSPSKKPIGGIALFGGVDLFAGASSLKPAAAIEEQSDKTEDDAGESATNYQSEIRRRAPLLKDTKEISVSFDDPIDTSNTLQSAVKDRVKVQTKRRPPSRKGRLAAASKSGIDVVTEPKEDKEIKVNLPESSRKPESKEPSLVKPKEKIISNKPAPFLAVTADFRSPSTEEEDLFSVMDLPDKTLLSNTREKVKKPSLPTKIAVEEPIETDGDLFGSKTNLPVSVEPVNEVISAQKDAKPQNLFKKCNKPPPKNQSLFGDDEDDDIFSVSNTKNESKLSQSKVSKDTVDSSGPNKSSVKDIFADDADDIFKSVPSNTEKKKLPKLSSMSKSIFDDDTDDDSDIFAPKTSGTSSSTKTISTGKQSTTMSGKRKENLVKKTVKHSTDVFDDPLLGGQSDKD